MLAPRIWLCSFYPILGSPCLLFSLTANSFGPSSYWMKGFVYLEPGVAEKFKDSYAWRDVTLNPSMQLDTDEGKEHSWAFNEEFNEYVKSSDYIGKFYFDVRNELVYFEVEK
ncbi:hypothetical protein [Paenibacillus stellifer]|uniref:hypothetical protein n=1 Tax=Paenibacillus stellifer TaxID=169760 RepID=UPI0014704772|nr:hypothetical protein [Paenibacillus stellifer]